MTPLSEWRSYWRQGARQWQTTADGQITVFPQLALVAAVRKQYSKSDRPLIAWCFNVGRLYGGWKGVVARSHLRQVDMFIVHSTAECRAISTWLGVGEKRVQFLPLQRGHIEVSEVEEDEEPFVLAMGSAHRDFDSLFQAVGELGYKTIVVAASHAIGDRPIPGNVVVRTRVGHEECLKLAQRARINVVPLLPNDTAAGQVTIVESLRMGRAVIASDVVGSRDYITNGTTGLLVRPQDASELRSAMQRVWLDADYRTELSRAASAYAEANLSDEAAGSSLKLVLDKFL